eukprot:5750544-Karenia_brevis.AAC.1
MQIPNFDIMGDGDLWKIFWHVAAAKGPSSIKVTKVKGHAHWADVKHSQELTRIKVGNDAADHIATQAYDETHGMHVTTMSAHYYKRYNSYIQFMHSLHGIIVRVYKSIAALRESEAFQLTQQKTEQTITTTPPIYLGK